MRHNRAQQVLIEARALLARPYGWTTKRPSREKKLPSGGLITAYCSTGALNMAAWRLGANQSTTVPSAHLALTNAVGASGGSIASWNDAPGRKKREVLAAFDDAIERADS